MIKSMLSLSLFIIIIGCQNIVESGQPIIIPTSSPEPMPTCIIEPITSTILQLYIDLYGQPSKIYYTLDSNCVTTYYYIWSSLTGYPTYNQVEISFDNSDAGNWQVNSIRYSYINL